MKERLLNILKNLIIILALVVVLIIILETTVFANSVGIEVLMKQKISGWYMIIRNVSLAAMLVLLLIVGMKLLVFSVSPEDKALFKKLIIDWLIALVLIFFIHYVMYGIIKTNEFLVGKAKSFGYKLSGIDTESDEYDLYESSMSKAYEIKFTSGTIGMIMYIMLVVYTYKFIIIYAKRYINIIVLILIAPISCLITAFKKVLSGKSAGLMGKWVKEFVYNVFIQTIHAIFYASLVGLTLKLSDDAETFIGAILTLIIFGFIFKLDGLFRKIFNFVGGKNTIKQIDLYGSIKSAKRMATDYKNGEGAWFDKKTQLQNYFDDNSGKQIALDLSRKAMPKLVGMQNRLNSGVKNTISSLDGRNIKVTSEEIQKEREKMQNPNILGRIYNTLQGATFRVFGAGVVLATNIEESLRKKILEISNKVKLKVQNLQQNEEMIKRLPLIIKAHEQDKLDVPEIPEVYDTVVDLEKDSQELVEQFKLKMEQSTEDIVATVYELEGPQAFLYSQTGSIYMGMSMLASELYQNSYYYALNENAERKTLRLQTAPYNMSEEENGAVEKQKNKRYSFSRFNSVSTRRIVHGLNTRLVMNSPYLRRINILKKHLQMGELNLRDFKIKTTEVKYTAKINSANQMKYQADLALETYNERLEDSKWAEMSSLSLDIKSRVDSKIAAEFLKINEMPSNVAAVNRLVAMGKAIRIDEKTIAIFDASSERMLGMSQTASELVDSIKDNSTTKYKILEGVISETASDLSIQSIFNNESETTVLNLIPNEYSFLESLQNVGVVTTNGVVQYVYGEDGSIQKQLVDSTGNITNPSEELSEGMIQRIVSMEGTIIEQRVNSKDGKFSIDGQYQTVENASKETIQEVHHMIYQDVNMNLDSNVTAGNVDAKLAELAKIVNNMATYEISSEQEDEFDNLMSQLLIPNDKEVLLAMADNAIIEAAIQAGVYDLREFDLRDNEEAKLKTLDLLISNGVVSTRAKSDQELNDEVMDWVEDRQAGLSNEDMVNTLAQKQAVNNTPSLAKALVMATAAAIRDDVNQNLENAKNVTLDELEKIRRTYTRNDTGTTATEEYTVDDMFKVYVSGAVAKPGRVDVRIGSRIRDAVIKAGVIKGVTDWDGLDDWLGENLGMNKDTPIGQDNLSIWVPRLQDRDDGYTDRSEENALVRCRNILERIAERYIKQNKISHIETLKKLVHKNMLIHELEKETKREKVTRSQLSKVVDDFIEDPSSTRYLVDEEVKVSSKKDDKSSKDKDQDIQEQNEYRVYVSGAVATPGKYEISIGTTFRDLIYKAGVIAGTTDWEGLNRWLGRNLGVSIESQIDRDNLVIWVPRLGDDTDEDSTQEVEQMLDRCRPKAKKVMDKYLQENNITDINALKKLVHKNMIVYQLQKEFRKENISREQIDMLIEEYIKDPKSKRFLTTEERVKDKQKVVKIDDVNAQKDFLEGEKEREENIAENEILEQTSRLLREATASAELQDLFAEMNMHRESILAGNSNREISKKKMARNLYDNMPSDEIIKRMSKLA